MKKNLKYYVKSENIYVYGPTVDDARFITDSPTGAAYIEREKKKLACALAFRDIDTSRKNVESGQAEIHFDTRVDTLLSGMSFVGLEAGTPLKADTVTVKVSYKDRQVEETIPNYTWCLLTELEKKHRLESVAHEYARSLTRKEWRRRMIDEGVDESEFAFAEEAALSDEEADAFLLRVAEIEKDVVCEVR